MSVGKYARDTVDYFYGDDTASGIEDLASNVEDFWFDDFYKRFPQFEDAPNRKTLMNVSETDLDALTHFYGNVLSQEQYGTPLTLLAGLFNEARGLYRGNRWGGTKVDLINNFAALQDSNNKKSEYGNILSQGRDIATQELDDELVGLAIDEALAIDRVKKLFDAKYANVQPHSGAQANGAVYLALLNPGDPILGMSLNSGGHLTHGAKVALSGKWLNSFHYEVDKESGLIDYEQVEKLAIEHKPKLIIAGGSAYSRVIY